jgi:hypothetical protein
MTEVLPSWQSTRILPVMRSTWTRAVVIEDWASWQNISTASVLVEMLALTRQHGTWWMVAAGA